MATEGQGGKTILIVEDDAGTREALSMILTAQGFAVVGAANGQEALGLLRGDVRPDLILLDLMMPIMDGWQFRREQKQDPEIADIPLVVITATGKRQVLIDAADLVMKPLDLNRLFETIERYC